MGKLRELINSIKKSQERIVDKLIKEDCQDQTEFNKLILVKEAERELDYLEDLATLYESDC